MTILGVVPIGTLAITTIPHGSLSPNVTLAPAAGVGVARTLADQVTTSSFGVAAIGAVGIIAANLVLPLSGAQGIGVARAPMLQVSVSGIGTVGLLTANPSDLVRANSVGTVGVLAVQISGGGSSSALARRDSRLRAGLERIRKQYEPVPAAPPVSRVPLPPPGLVRLGVRPPPLPKRPAAIVDQSLLPDIGSLMASIHRASIASDMLKAIDGRNSEQDEADIAAVLAFLESQEQS